MGDDASEEAGFLPRRFGRVAAVAPFGRAVEPRRASRVAAWGAFDSCGYRALGRGRRCGRRTQRMLVHPHPVGSRRHRVLSAHGICADAICGVATSCFRWSRGALVHIATARQRDLAREREQALLFEALLAAIGRETAGIAAARSAGCAGAAFAGEELPNSGELWRSLLAEHPEMVAELTLAAMLREAPSVEAMSPAIAPLRRTRPRPRPAGQWSPRCSTRLPDDGRLIVRCASTNPAQCGSATGCAAPALPLPWSTRASRAISRCSAKRGRPVSRGSISLLAELCLR